ncbi:DegT/DnrJ/EryC1/StrS family aminotransferase [Jannaschia ovalis]|uniref:DegT/DnrJ/EryC1/StrS aminotransferase family protein n=1 Tax=Jannaschia ovalis TaxID=3038773 RepID=A0ABY8LC47_9RHOB|nr:DegT/DnrJ/EryC1/StrS aminotransferase family protein [Jannaschia sp. GRR-S6-38]WGH78706.1 DegT/DnrJ/EryC1/StrS aminotransferase family protein [Jannaschia sp. GRR-S6-38]
MPAQRWPVFDEEQIAAVADVLRSGKVNAWTGPDVNAFEAEYADHLGVAHAIAFANGSVSLNAALAALDLSPGDEVIVTPRSFVASASCVLLFGATPVFAEIDRDSGNITPETIAERITPRTKGIIPVHLGGWPCDMPAIMALARARGLWVVEDCAQAHGAMIDGRPVGSFGDFASFSFCQDKILSTGGEGGLLAVSDEALWRRAWSYKDHGKDHATVFAEDHPPGFRWLHAHPGTNLRMPGTCAALGRIQLRRLPDWHRDRARNAARLARAFAPSPLLRTPMPRAGLTHAWYRFYTYVRPERLADGWSRDRIVAEINAAGFPAFSGSCSEIYLEKTFDGANRPAEPLPVARELGETSLAFLVDPTWSLAGIDDLIAAAMPILYAASAETTEAVRAI